MATNALLAGIEDRTMSDGLATAWAAIRRSTPPDLGALRESIGEGLLFASGQGICLLRHGETVTNAQGLVTGARDVHLTDSGRQQAVTAGKQLSHCRFATAWASSLERSRETLDIVLEASHNYGTARVTDCRLSERALGEMEGRKNKYVPEFASGDLNYAPPGGENYLSVVYRVLSFLHDLSFLPPLYHGMALVSTHMGPLRIFDAIVHNRSETASELLSRRYVNASPMCDELKVIHWPAFLESEAASSQLY